MSCLSPIDTANVCRSTSALSAASDSTYHSFNDIELYEPVVASPPRQPVQVRSPLWKESKDGTFESIPMRRQDSGYESMPSGSRSGGSHDFSHRRGSATSSNLSQSHARPRTRPSMRRANRSTPSPRTGRAGGPQLNRTMSLHTQQNTYYHFPTPKLTLDIDEGVHDVEPLYPPPPQTTHYWTSDHSRKLEYAAIDAASRGVKGWIMKHVVPDCFIPKENRRLRFDDDSGSVRRYRLELECDDGVGKERRRGKRLRWLFGR